MGLATYPERAVEWSPYAPEAEANDAGLINRELLGLILRAVEATPDGEDVVVTVPERSNAPDTLLIGGDPIWLQGDEPPVCPRCGGPTRLQAQVDARIDEGGGDVEAYWLPFGSDCIAHMIIFGQKCDPTGSAFLWQTT